MVLVQGLAVAGLRAARLNWFAFYRAHGDSWPPAIEAVVVRGGVPGLAVPGLVVWGVAGSSPAGSLRC